MKLLILVIMSFVLAFLVLVVAYLLSKKDELMSSEKISPFECGFSPYNNSRGVFSVQFFLVTLVFLIFDVELVILFPFLMEVKYQYEFFSYIMLISFLMVLTWGLILEWSQEMLEWYK